MTGQKEAVNANGSLSAALRVSVILKFCKEERKQLWVRESFVGEGKRVVKKERKKEQKKNNLPLKSQVQRVAFSSALNIQRAPLLPGELGAEHDSLFISSEQTSLGIFRLSGLNCCFGSECAR